eukprot:m.103993 g.103993  ORF g.103993 m.103993 type:complete len:832 (-) comp13249_c1_seq1:93-2588(-)
MNLEVEVLDEHLQPLVFPDWPGKVRGWLPSAPIPDGAKYHLSTQHLASCGYSLSLNDKMAILYEVLPKAIPHMDAQLAVHRRMKKIIFIDEECPDSMLLSEYSVKVRGQGDQRRIFGKNDCLRVVTSTVVVVHDLNDQPVDIEFEIFNADEVTVKDVKERLAEALRCTESSIFLVREYPTTRRLMCHDDARLYGFKGVKERGIWKEKPHTGPLEPCRLTTPPDLKLKMIPQQEYKLLEAEEEWWQIIESQPGWVGHEECIIGPRENVTLMMKPARAPGWYLAKFGDAGQQRFHSLAINTLHEQHPTKGAQPIVKPHRGFFESQVDVHEDATVEAVGGGPHYMPTPAEIRQQGKKYREAKPLTSYGDGFVKSGTYGSSQRVTYELHLESDGEVKLLVSAIEADLNDNEATQPPEHVYEGVLAQGITQCHYFKGVHYYRWHSDHGQISETRKLPFCLFQLTASNTIPDVVTSPMGKRYAGVRERSFTILNPGTAPGLVGYMDKFVPIDEFMATLADSPQIVMTNMAVLHQGVHENLNVFILWNVKEAAQLNLPLPEVTRLKQHFDLAFRAYTRESIEQELEPYGKVYGVGPDPASVKEKKAPARSKTSAVALRQGSFADSAEAHAPPQFGFQVKRSMTVSGTRSTPSDKDTKGGTTGQSGGKGGATVPKKKPVPTPKGKRPFSTIGLPSAASSTAPPPVTSQSRDVTASLASTQVTSSPFTAAKGTGKSDEKSLLQAQADANSLSSAAISSDEEDGGQVEQQSIDNDRGRSEQANDSAKASVSVSASDEKQVTKPKPPHHGAELEAQTSSDALLGSEQSSSASESKGGCCAIM